MLALLDELCNVVVHNAKVSNFIFESAEKNQKVKIKHEDAKTQNFVMSVLSYLFFFLRDFVALC